MTDLKPESVWYSLGEHLGLDRVVILGTVVFPLHGKYVLYRMVDIPYPNIQPASCAHEDTFRLIHTPMEMPPCEILPPENFSFKTFSPPQPRWFTGVRKLWGRLTTSW